LNLVGEHILESLKQVAAERAVRASDPPLGHRVALVKAFQHQRFACTYADVLADPRYAAAARFFLEDLYGPTDFSARDQQFARIVPALVRLFPGEIVHTVADLAALHALSERLDTTMGRVGWVGPLDADQYAHAWRAVACRDDRERQIQLMVRVGSALDRYTHRVVLRQSLRLMRRPAQAAGLGALQLFLERGFDTFRAMHGAAGFLQLIADRERALAAALFAGAKRAECSGGLPGLDGCGAKESGQAP
jgi:hypothetical protein